MQTNSNTESTWYLVSKEIEDGIPPRIVITPPFRIGRREGFDLCLSCRNVSGLHAELLHEYGQLWVEDLNSTNGTFVNGAIIRKKTSLKSGDTVQIGQTIFTVECVEPESESAEDPSIEIPVSEATEERFERLLKEGVVPFFQPVYNISGNTKRRIGYEVLGRSRMFGIKTPDQMFAVATNLEKESELSRTLRLRGIEAADKNLASSMMLFVNTHPAEMDCDEILASLKEIRAKYPSRLIMLEFSEQVLYTLDTYAELIKAVKALGVELVIHDFGAGQIRLAELAEVAPDVVKFDSALLQNIDNAEPKRLRLVSAMVKMVTELGIAPMAEFVETEAEHETLKQLGFELGQGYYYGHPAEAPTAAELVADASRASDARPIDKLKSLQVIADDQSVDEESPTTAKSGIAAFASPRANSQGYEDERWLLAKDDSCFTVQLMFAPTIEEAENFLTGCKPKGEYAIYRKWSSNSEWFVVVFGVFDDQFKAHSAKKLFADTGHSSFVRDLPMVKKEIRSTENVSG